MPVNNQNSDEKHQKPQQYFSDLGLNSISLELHFLKALLLSVLEFCTINQALNFLSAGSFILPQTLFIRSAKENQGLFFFQCSFSATLAKASYVFTYHPDQPTLHCSAVWQLGRRVENTHGWVPAL